MIIDSIKNIHRYASMRKNLVAGLEYIASSQHTDLAPGKYVLDGDNLFALVQEYQPKQPVDGKLEAHKRYIDIQYVVTGEEYIGYADTSSVELTEYNPEKDFQGANGNVDMVKVPAGFFMILYPNDVHMPGIRIAAETEKVRKVVVKVKSED